MFLNKIEHRDLRRQVTTRDEAKRSEQTLPPSEITFLLFLLESSSKGSEMGGTPWPRFLDLKLSLKVFLVSEKKDNL